MSADPRAELDIAPAGGLEGPLYFDSGEHKLFGWLHRGASDASPSVGLVICKPFGFESMSCYLTERAFAEAAAGLGMPSLRFDYLGTGDSEDLDPRADQVDAWLNDVVAAVNELRRRTGVGRVCLLGIRLGALLATLAVSRCEGACALIAVAPVISGRRYLRELRTFDLAASAPPHGGKPAQTDSLEVSGFPLSAATIASLSQIDLMTQGVPPASDLLVVDRTDLPAARAWSDQASGAGVRTQYVAVPGFIEMAMRAPNLTVVPQAIVATVRDWLARLQAVGSPRESTDDVRHGDRSPDPACAELVLGGDAGAAPSERPVFVASETLLFGIVTAPRKGELRRRGVILLNSGGDYHIGPRRMYVSLARHWASRGYVVLRMDLPGLGDSPPPSGRGGNDMFPPSAVNDIGAAIEFLRRQYAVREVTVAGVCSGAYHSFRAAVDGLPVNRILMVNPLSFFPEDATDIEEIQPWEIVHKPADYRARLRSAETWRRVLTGNVNLWRVARIYLHSPLMTLRMTLRDLARRLHIRVSNDLGRELERVRARGVQLVFVFSRDDAGIKLLKSQSGLSARRLEERYRIRIIDGADHTFTRGSARTTLEQILTEELFALHACGASGGELGVRSSR